MAVERLPLTEALASYLQKLRQTHPLDGTILTAENLSKALGKNRAWMSQIESRRLKYIRTSDVSEIFRLLLGEEAFSSNEYEEFSAKFLKDASYKKEYWYTQCHRVNAYAYEAQPKADAILTGLPELTKDLERFKKGIIALYKAADKQEQMFAIRNAVETLNRNLAYSDELTTLLSSIPLHFLAHAPLDYQAKTKNKLMEMYQEITEKYKPKSSFFFFRFESEFILPIINKCIQLTINANSTLYRFFSDSEDISKLITEYNTLVDSINTLCKDYDLTRIVLNSISDIGINSVAILEKHSPELQKLLKDLNLIRDQLKKNADDDTTLFSM